MVCQMNEYEAHKKRLPELSVQDWPEWAQRDFRLACESMVTVRADALAEGRKVLEELAYLSRNRTTTRIILRDRIAALLPNNEGSREAR